MKKILFVMAAVIAMMACNNKQADTPATGGDEVNNEVVENDTTSSGVSEGVQCILHRHCRW